MVTVRAMTLIEAPAERCFKLSVSVDLHVVAAAATGEEAIAGVTSGLMSGGQTVTWRSKHFTRSYEQENVIDVWRPYSYFREVMVTGRFKSFEHDHHFAAMNDGTRMRDEIRFAASGSFGKFAEMLVLKEYLAGVLKKRNEYLKRVAETDEWHHYLDGQPELNLQAFQGEAARVRGQQYAGY